mgnify:CR=1 FL=1
MPRPRIRNIAKGRSEAALGVRELALTFADLKESLTAEKQKASAKKVYEVIGAACETIRKEAQRIARSKGVDESVINSIFTFSDPEKGPRKRRPSGLVGVSKQRTLIEWRAGKHPASQTLEGRPLIIKRAPGEILSVSLAFMEEFGTSRKYAKPYFRPAIKAARSLALSEIENGLRGIIDSIVGVKRSQSIGGEFL